MTRPVFGAALLVDCSTAAWAQRQQEAAGLFANVDKTKPLVGDLAACLNLKGTPAQGNGLGGLPGGPGWRWNLVMTPDCPAGPVRRDGEAARGSLQAR